MNCRDDVLATAENPIRIHILQNKTFKTCDLVRRWVGAWSRSVNLISANISGATETSCSVYPRTVRRQGPSVTPTVVCDKYCMEYREAEGAENTQTTLPLVQLCTDPVENSPPSHIDRGYTCVLNKLNSWTTSSPTAKEVPFCQHIVICRPVAAARTESPDRITVQRSRWCTVVWIASSLHTDGGFVRRVPMHSTDNNAGRQGMRLCQHLERQTCCLHRVCLSTQEREC